MVKLLNSDSKSKQTEMTASSYQSFAEIGDDNHILIHVLPNDNRSGLRHWQYYIHDLDNFFTKIYRYHQRSGFACIVVSQVLELIQISFVILFTIFLLHFVDYDILFKNSFAPNKNVTDKVTISDVLRPVSDVHITNAFEIMLIVMAVLFLVIKTIRCCISVVESLAIKSFYMEALRIQDCTLFSWQDIQTRLIGAQHLCLIQEGQINELVIHNRILRHHNYMIALINKGLLPIHFKIPILGETIFLTEGLQFNLKLLFFKGPLALFENNWKVRDEIKASSNRAKCAALFARYCICLSVINLLLLPFIFIGQMLFTFYKYAEALKRDPSMILGMRNWTLYARWYCRHFNELDHQLNDRFNRGYKPATKYMNSFSSPMHEVIARFAAFIAGTVFSVLLLLMVFDGDVIVVEHVITLMTALAGVIALSRAFIPSEVPSRYSRAELNALVLEHIHYKPHAYAPYTLQARTAMSSVFQYKLITIIEELVSPLITPFILLCYLRPRALELIDFFHNYTIEMSGTGDVCTFAMLNIAENGNPQWRGSSVSKSTKQIKIEDNVTNVPASALQSLVTQNGKLELSLINFKLTNPNWNPNNDSQQQFINNVKASYMFKEEDEYRVLRSGGQSMSRSRLSPIGGNTPPPSTSSSSLNENDIESNAYKHERERIMNSLSNVVPESEERAAAMSLSTLYLHQFASNSVMNVSQQNIKVSESEPLLYARDSQDNDN